MLQVSCQNHSEKDASSIHPSPPPPAKKKSLGQGSNGEHFKTRGNFTNSQELEARQKLEKQLAKEEFLGVKKLGAMVFAEGFPLVKRKERIKSWTALGKCFHMVDA